MRNWFPWLRPATNPAETSGDVSEPGPSGNGFATALKARAVLIPAVARSRASLMPTIGVQILPSWDYGPSAARICAILHAGRGGTVACAGRGPFPHLLICGENCRVPRCGGNARDGGARDASWARRCGSACGPASARGAPSLRSPLLRTPCMSQRAEEKANEDPKHIYKWWPGWRRRPRAAQPPPGSQEAFHLHLAASMTKPKWHQAKFNVHNEALP